MSGHRKRFLMAALTTLALIFFVLVFIFQQTIGFKKSLSINLTLKVSVAVVPHHDLAQDLRRGLLANVALLATPQAIILVSTNHFDSGNSGIITTDRTWKLENAIVEPESNIIGKLVESGIAINEEGAFSREHGISNVIGDVNNSFPDAKVIPIIIKPAVDQEKVLQLSQSLSEYCSGCLMVASIDFSHYLPGTLAEVHDSFAIKALENLDADSAWRAETDSPQAMQLVIAWAKINQTENFRLAENTNSAKILNEAGSESTSYILGWYEKGKKTNQTISFMLAGDAMFDRYIDYKFPGDNLKKIFANFSDRTFRGVDLAMANLEGAISSLPTVPNIDPNNLKFLFPPETANVLDWLNLNAVSLANNHSGNGGEEALLNTRAVLDVKKIATIGDEGNIGVETFADQQISVITLNTAAVGTNINSQIEEAKNKSFFVLIFPHWGNEYQKTHSNFQQEAAHKWIDQGADLVVGSHPHVIQDAEIYNGKPIIYSLGNFVFDQIFSRETQQGLILAGKASEKKLSLTFLPVQSKNLQVELMRGEEKVSIIDGLKQGLGQPVGSHDYGYDSIEFNR